MDIQKILIAEDYLDNFLLIDAFLRNYPCTLTHVENGKEALEKFQNETFDLLLIDIQMPVMNGLEFIKEIRKNGHTIPAIAQTAHAFAVDQEVCIEAGFTDYISKPINKKVLIELLEKYK